MADGLRLAVVGDVILDTYWFGSADRLSPEAPVPVVNYTHSSEHLGGAANVAHNLVSMGAQVDLYGVVGDDDAGRSVIDLLQKARIGYRGVVAEAGRPTTHKLRVVAGQHQIVRVDRERRTSVERMQQTRMLERLLAAGSYDALIVSDYGKGVVQPDTVSRIRQCSPVLAVDPVPAHGAWYAGADYATPNRKESQELAQTLGLHPWQPDATGARALASAMGLRRGMLLTLGAQGLLWADSDHHWQAQAQARAVYDVTGAGDTVVAAFVLSRLAGLTVPQAMYAANAAAGAVVAQLGIATIDQAEFQVIQTQAQEER